MIYIKPSLCFFYIQHLILCIPQLALLDEFLFRNSLCWGPAPNLLCLMNFFLKFSLLGPRPQLALLDEFLFEILFVGAPP
ncbi:hypothetical protein B7454_01640 [Staphylococcus lugdunensis]|nr:hypothetical protein B7454_01640 [Staphylococcus lugdunensis]